MEARHLMYTRLEFERLMENPSEVKDLSLDDFEGNFLTAKEKAWRLHYGHYSVVGDLDPEFIPYLERINKVWFVCTTQCCTGHGESSWTGGRRAHVDFRCYRSPQFVIDIILKPLQEKFGTDCNLYTDNNRLRYCLWMDNETWEEEVEFFIQLLEEFDQRLFNAQR